MLLEIRNVTKRYPKGQQALQDVSLTMKRGLFGLLGPNGAGKTTLMKILCTLLEPTSGSVKVDGAELAADRDLVRRRLGYLPQDWGAPRTARCGEVLDLVLRLRGQADGKARSREIDELLAQVNLVGQRKKKVRTLSGGMLRRLGVAHALAGSPELLVLDEPTVGLDPDERVEFRNLLSELGAERTIVLSTHVVADVGNTCESVGVLDGGRVVFEGAPSEFAARARGRVFEAVVPTDREAEVRNASTVVSTVPGAEGTIFRVVAEKSSLPGTLEWTAVEPTLEDAYLAEVGEEALEALAAGAGA